MYNILIKYAHFYNVLYIFFGQTLRNPTIPFKSEQQGLTLMSTRIMSHDERSQLNLLF